MTVNPRQFQLTFNEVQGQVIVDALDLYMRLQAGQWDTGTLSVLTFPSWGHDGIVAQALQTLKREWFPALSPGASDFGIGQALVADDLRMAVRGGLAWSRNPEGNAFNVAFDAPMYRSEEPPPVMLAFDGRKAQRIRKKARDTAVVPRLGELLGTQDLEAAVERVEALLATERKWLARERRQGRT